MDLIVPFWRAFLPGVAVAGVLTAWASLWPRSRVFGPVRWCDEAGSSPTTFALLFEGMTEGAVDNEALLEALATRHVIAAFAIDATFAASASPQLLRQFDAAGHLLVNAGPRFAPGNLLANRVAWRDAIDATDDLIHEKIGRRPRIFAPPYAAKSPIMLREAVWGGHVPVVRARGDHRFLPVSWNQARLLRAPAGGIVCLRANDSRSLRILPELIDGWRSRGRVAIRMDTLLDVQPYRSPRD
ncbi:MAG: polysaccharide deacetylase family protein [Planctomycetota bacterium]